MNPEDRLIELETRLSYQDDAVRVLSDTVARQQKQIDQLERLCRHLVERLRAQKDERPPNTPEEELPPHY